MHPESTLRDDLSWLLIISGYTAVGKDTVIAKLMQKHGFVKPPSYTTRPGRPGEVDGRDYVFVTEPAFNDLMSEGMVLEWMKVHGKWLYGSPRKPVATAMESGKGRIILNVNVDGCQSLRRRFQSEPWNDAVLSIFLSAPMDTLIERIKRRQPDISGDELDARLNSVEKETEMSVTYDRIVHNEEGKLDQTIEEIADVMLKRQEKRLRQIA